LDHGLYALKRQSFSPNRAPKMRERNQLFFGLQLMSKEFLQHPAIQTKIEQHFLWIFNQIKVGQPTGRQDSMQTVIRIGGWIHFCMKRFRTLKSLQIFKNEIKKSKTYSG
jgi:hypothetical protein